MTDVSDQDRRAQIRRLYEETELISARRRAREARRDERYPWLIPVGVIAAGLLYVGGGAALGAILFSAATTHHHACR